MEWEDVINSIGFWYNVFIEWYISAPIVAQVFAIIGIITLLALAITLVYYVIKGIAYLVYYIFKGLYLLLRYIGYGFYKLTEGFYFLVSGKKKPSKQESSHTNIHNTTINQYNYILEFCSECGRSMSERMKLHFEKNGMAFCENCGKQLTLNHALRTLNVSH